VSSPVGDETITCASCEYCYPRSKAICGMCGTAAPAVEPLQPLSTVHDELSGADHEAGSAHSDNQQRCPHPGFPRLIPVVVVSIVLMGVTSLFYEVRKHNLPTESGSVADLTATSGRPKLENTGRRHIHNPVKGVQHVVAAKLGTAQTSDAAKEDDPVELWKAVKRGNVSAEVALANLYLEGEAVPQNCEQAHMLLFAASTKGSKAAANFLKSSYAERCE
jgi:hypothetical protein